MSAQPEQPSRLPRRFFASLAHQRAGQVIALREATQHIQRTCQTVDEAVAVLHEHAERLERDIDLIATEAGHA